MTSQHKYFGTDGIRGKVGSEPITPEFVMRLGYAAGCVLTQREHMPGSENPAILIGKDTRISGYMLEAALQAGFAAAGVDVFLAGPCPTPAVAYLTRALRLQAGVVISASHNAYDDNGIKFFSAQGFKLPDALEAQIEARMAYPAGCVKSSHLGRARRIEDARGRYIEFCKSSFPNALDLRGLRIVVDCAHGAAYNIAPCVLHELGAEVISIGVQPNGLNINDKVGATAPDHLSRAMIEHQADVGLALDGDGDRLVMADREGRIYDGDALLYIIAKAHAERLKNAPLGGVVGTIMSNLGLEHAVSKIGFQFERARVGDRHVLERLLARGWALGGENSGHLICLDAHSTGDGIIAALQVLAALRTQSQTLAEATAALTLLPQKMINLPIEKGFDWQGNAAIEAATREAEYALGTAGRVVLRPSGTEPVLRVMVEAPTLEAVEGHATSIAAAVKQAVASSVPANQTAR